MPARPVSVQRDKGDTEAKCEDRCGFWASFTPGTMVSRTAWSAAEVRTQARQHVRETGHEVLVTVRDETRYAPRRAHAGKGITDDN